MNFTKKEKLGYGILGILILATGLYSLIVGVISGSSAPGGYFFKGISARIIGLFIAALGAWLLYAVIKTPASPPENDENG